MNFFKLREHLYLVDLPGYGYARAPKHMISSWQRLIKEYLQGRPKLKRVFLLLDARRGVKQSDNEMMSFLDDCAVNYQIILTKSDKASKTELENSIKKCKTNATLHAALHPDIMVTSSASGTGIDILRAEIGKLVQQ